MSLHEVLQLARKSQQLTLMQLVEKTGLSYGKVYRILMGTLAKPDTDTLKQLAQAMNLDYTYLFELTGYITKREKSVAETLALPVLSWRYCTVAYPFPNVIELGLSDRVTYFHQSVSNGFAIEIDATSQLLPYFASGDLIICDPDSCPEHNDTVLYRESCDEPIRFGLYKKYAQEDAVIVSLHQDQFGRDIEVFSATAAGKPPVILAIICAQKKAALP